MTGGRTPPRVLDDFDRLGAELSGARRLLCCLDFDGTLAPIVESPGDATMPAETEAALDQLIDTSGLSIAIVSGRRLADLERRVDVPVTLAGNHGLELNRDGRRAIHPIAAVRQRSISAVCRALQSRLSSIPGARVEHKGLTATVHVRTVPPANRSSVREITTSAVDELAAGDLEWSTGKRVIEITPALDWGKGDAVELIESDMPTGTRTIVVGDDETDEHGFAAVEPDGVSVFVGEERPSHASWRVHGPSDVTALLTWLARHGTPALESSSCGLSAGSSFEPCHVKR